jgi:hypothetical protein
MHLLPHLWTGHSLSMAQLPRRTQCSSTSFSSICIQGISVFWTANHQLLSILLVSIRTFDGEPVGATNRIKTTWYFGDLVWFDSISERKTGIESEFTNNKTDSWDFTIFFQETCAKNCKDLNWIGCAYGIVKIWSNNKDSFLDKAETMRNYILVQLFFMGFRQEKRMFIQFHHETRGNLLDLSGYEHNREGMNEQECSNQTGLQRWRFQQRMI